MTDQWEGHWAWVHQVDTNLERIEQAGAIDNQLFGLPPRFMAASDRLGVWAKISQDCDTLLDTYEDDEISDPSTLRGAAAIIEAEFINSEFETLSNELAQFLRHSADASVALEFCL